MLYSWNNVLEDALSVKAAPYDDTTHRNGPLSGAVAMGRVAWP